MQPITKLLKNNQLKAYFILTFLISWILFNLPLIISLDELSNFMIIIIGGAGPALAAIIMALIINPRRIQTPNLKKWIVFLIVFFLTLILKILYLQINLTEVSLLALFLLIINAAIVGYIISGGLSGFEGIKNLLNKLYVWRVPIRWYFFAFFFYPAVLFIALIYAVYNVGLSITEILNQISGTAFYGLIITYGYVGLVRGPLREEVGWRGFALPRLQNLYSPLVGSIILFLIWVVWHLPLHYNGILPVGIEGFLVRFYYFGLIFLFTWLYNHSNGSLLLTTIFHTSANTAATLMIFAPTVYNEWVAIFLINLMALIVIIKDKMWRKLPQDSSAVYEY